MDLKETDRLELVSSLLVARAEDMGVYSISVKGEALNLEDAFDFEGPIAWAIFMHANILSRLTGINGMPFECVTDADAVFGNRASIKSDGLPLSFGLFFLDTALEHAVVVAMQGLQCTSEEWRNLPDNLRVVSVEDYVMDIGSRWIDQRLITGTVADRIVNWPVLLDFKLHDEMISSGHGVDQGSAIKINPLSTLSPR